MKEGIALIILALGFAGVMAAEPAVRRAVPLTRDISGRILELVKQDARRLQVAETVEAGPPNDQIINGQPVVEGVVKLEPFIVVEKKPIQLPPRLKPTLDNFFYGDGTIAESKNKRMSLSAGPEGKGMVGIRFNLKF